MLECSGCLVGLREGLCWSFAEFQRCLSCLVGQEGSQVVFNWPPAESTPYPTRNLETPRLYPKPRHDEVGGNFGLWVPGSWGNSVW